jgi:septal ring factor EnvC (AmiA/AmiB activator)
LAAVQKPAVDEGMVEGKLAPPLVGGAGLGRGLAWPVTGVVTRSFGKTKSREFNTTLESAGIQIRAARGTPIKAVASGRVRYADWFQGYGKLVILDHGRGYYSLYAQASDLFVAPGDQVKTGQPIATVGDTGSLVGDSLYFEVRKDGLPQNPLLFLKKKKG